MVYSASMKILKAGEVAKRINVHSNTVRNWSSEYAAFLSADAVGAGSGSRRRFTEHDAVILATIADLRAKGYTPTQVTEALQSGRVVDVLPNLPTPEEEEARRDVALVPVAQLERALDEVRRIRDELERVTAERDRALERGETKTAELNATINELQAELGRAQGTLAERQPTRWWLQVVVGLVLFAALMLAVVVALLLRA